MDELRLRARLAAMADRHPAGLVVAEVADAADLQPALGAGSPDLEVVLARLDKARLARAHEQDPIGDAEALQEHLRALCEPLELRLRFAGGDEADHLDLVELVDSKDAPRVPA